MPDSWAGIATGNDRESNNRAFTLLFMDSTSSTHTVASLMTKFPVAYRCPHCNHGFARLTEKTTGSTSCPKCLKRFTRTSGRALRDEATKVRRQALERKHEKNKGIYAPDATGLTSAVIRGEQIPLSSAEAKFKARATQKGWRPHCPSWPDFLVETDPGLVAVEVKARIDELSPTQIESFTLLGSAGIPVYIWKDTKTTRGSLIRWAGGKALKKSALPGSQRSVVRRKED